MVHTYCKFLKSSVHTRCVFNLLSINCVSTRCLLLGNQSSLETSRVIIDNNWRLGAFTLRWSTMIGETCLKLLVFKLRGQVSSLYKLGEISRLRHTVENISLLEGMWIHNQWYHMGVFSAKRRKGGVWELWGRPFFFHHLCIHSFMQHEKVAGGSSDFKALRLCIRQKVGVGWIVYSSLYCPRPQNREEITT